MKYLGATVRVHPDRGGLGWAGTGRTDRFPGTIDSTVWKTLPGHGRGGPTPLPWVSPRDAWKDLADGVPALYGVVRTGDPARSRLLPEAADEAFDLPSGFVVLGYDVADDSAFSAIWGLVSSDAAYEAERRAWLADTDPGGLFADLEGAIRMCAWADRCWPLAFGHHGPFWAVAVAVPASVAPRFGYR